MKRLITAMAAMATGTVLATVPVTVNYVGHLTGVTAEDKETALTEQIVLMVFRLYDKPGLGRMSDKAAPLWGRRVSVALADGDFDLDLADTLGMPVEDAQHTSLADAICAAVNAGSSDLYVGVTPENDANAEIWPRQKLTAVPCGVQAAAVRAVEGDFTSTGGTFAVRGKMTVTGPATFRSNVSYGKATFGAKADVDLKSGLVVRGPLEAARVEATDMTVASTEVGTLQTQDAGKLSVTNRITCRGTLTWTGGAAWSATPVTAPTVAGSVETTAVSAERIVAGAFDNPKGFAINGWSVLGEWQHVTSLPAQSQEEQAFIVCNTSTGAQEAKTSIVSGAWAAPCDCIAYFQVQLLNLSAKSGTWLQFYIVPDVNVSDYSARNPIGVAALGPDADGALTTAVPIVLRKGELVKWLGYNDNASEGSSRKEIDHTTVTAIRYLAFNW